MDGWIGYQSISLFDKTDKENKKRKGDTLRDDIFLQRTGYLYVGDEIGAKSGVSHH